MEVKDFIYKKYTCASCKEEKLVAYHRIVNNQKWCPECFNKKTEFSIAEPRQVMKMSTEPWELPKPQCRPNSLDFLKYPSIVNSNPIPYRTGMLSSEEHQQLLEQSTTS